METKFYNLETFSDTMLHRYCDQLLINDNDQQSMIRQSSPMTCVHLNDQLIWLELLKNLSIRQALTSMFIRKNDDDNDNENLPYSSVKNVIMKTDNINRQNKSQLLLIGAISCLQLYVIDNFLFYIEKKSFDDCLEFVKDLFNTNDHDDKNFPSIDYELSIDGETIFPVARNIELLKLSRLVIEFLNKKSKSYFHDNHEERFHFILWSMRSAVIHQLSLSSTTGTLYDEIVSYTKELESIIDSNDEIKDPFRLNLYAEFVNIFLLFGDHENSKKFMTLAKKYSNISFDLNGQLGLRTQYQTKPVSQLMVDFKRISIDEADDKKHWECDIESKLTISMPTNEQLEDNTLLNEVKFINKENLNDNGDEQNLKLKPIEQVLILTWIKYVQRFGSTSDELLREQLLTYIQFLLRYCDEWIVQFNLLEIRSLQERTMRRRVERSLKQLQTLHEMIRYPAEKFFAEQASQRIRYFYSTLSDPFWKIEKHYADLLFSMGVYKSALDVYTRLGYWREMIECYRNIELMHKAEMIIRQKLAENDNQPDMHCLLGEITNDLDCYHYSWKISGNRYARAPKMLGLHYFNIKNFEKALEYFQQSIDANSMQLDVWYRIGYIGLLLEDWNLSIKAYRKVLQFDYDSFEAWNNLSKAYIKIGDKERAMKTLQEALKCNFEQWKIWENYIAVCADLGEYWEIIQAWHRLIDLKGKYLDDQIAEILVKCIEEEHKNCVDQNDQRLITKSLELFGHIASTSTGTAKIWCLYARLMLMADKRDSTKIEQFLQKSQRQILTDNWYKDIYVILNVLNHYCELSKDIFEFIEKYPQTSRSTLSSFRLSLNSITGQVEKQKSDLIEKSDSNVKEKFEVKFAAILKIQDQVMEMLK